MGLDPVDPGQQLAHLLGVILDLLNLIEVADATGMGQDAVPLLLEAHAQVVVTVMDQQAVLQIQRPGTGLRLLPVSRAHSSSTKIPLR